MRQIFLSMRTGHTGSSRLIKNWILASSKKSVTKRKFIKRTSTGKSGEKAQNTYAIIIEEEERYDGFYAIATKLEDDPAVIIGISEQRYKIEDCFRGMKASFSSRPIYHHTKEHFTAYFMICYTVLLIFWLLEAKLDAYEKTLKTGTKHFKYRIS